MTKRLASSRIASFLAAAALLGAGLLAMPQAGQAATMADVEKAIADQRYWDAFQDLRPLAEAGNAQAQYELAGFYHWGRVGAANFDKARKWYDRSARQGNVDAMVGLAIMNATGQGGPVDRQAAVKWLVIASSQRLPADSATKIAATRDELAQGIPPKEMETILAEARGFAPTPEHPEQ